MLAIESFHSLSFPLPCLLSLCWTRNLAGPGQGGGGGDRTMTAQGPICISDSSVSVLSFQFSFPPIYLRRGAGKLTLASLDFIFFPNITCFFFLFFAKISDFKNQKPRIYLFCSMV